MVSRANRESTQKLATAGSCYHSRTRRSMGTGGVPESRGQGCITAARISMDGLQSGVGSQEEPLTTRDTTDHVSPPSNTPVIDSRLNVELTWKLEGKGEKEKDGVGFL